MTTNKKKKLLSVNKYLDDKYGEVGTPTHEDFQEKALSWYYGKILKDKRKELNLTQLQLAKKTGLNRSYISRIEQGNTDIQLSSLLRISRALGLQLNLV